MKQINKININKVNERKEGMAAEDRVKIDKIGDRLMSWVKKKLTNVAGRDSGKNNLKIITTNYKASYR